jgi:hypothetical protein
MCGVIAFDTDAAKLVGLSPTGSKRHIDFGRYRLKISRPIFQLGSGCSRLHAQQAFLNFIVEVGYKAFYLKDGVV